MSRPNPRLTKSRFPAFYLRACTLKLETWVEDLVPLLSSYKFDEGTLFYSHLFHFFPTEIKFIINFSFKVHYSVVFSICAMLRTHHHEFQHTPITPNILHMAASTTSFSSALVTTKFAFCLYGFTFSTHFT